MEIGKPNNIKANSFNINLSEEYHLSVQIGLKNISYYIININTRNVEYFKKIATDKEIINADEILKLNFTYSSIVFVNFPFTLIPNELFIEKDSKELLEMTNDVYDIIKSDKINEIDAHLIYSIPDEINDLVFTFFPNSKQYAQQSILIKQFKELDNKDDNAYLYINDNVLNIFVLKNQKLIFNNSFNFESTTDILYFTLFSFEQLKLDTETVNLKLYGEIIKNDEIHQLLYEYIRYIDFGSKPKNLNISSEFNSIKDHQFYGLFS